MKRLWFWVLFLLLFAACSPKAQRQRAPVRKAYPYVVKVTDFDGAGGVSIDYYVSKTSIVVVRRDDFGSPPRELLNRDLTDEEKEDWNAYLSTLDIDSLKDEYVDPAFCDGLQLTYYFRLDENHRRISVQNYHVPELSDLFEKIRDYVPDELKPDLTTFYGDYYDNSEVEGENEDYD